MITSSTLRRWARLAGSTMLLAILALCSSVASAGGPSLRANPTDPANPIVERWLDSALPIPWVMSADGIPGSGIDNATLSAELEAAFNRWADVPTARVSFVFEGEVGFREGGDTGSNEPNAADRIDTTGTDGRNLVTFTDPDLYFPPGRLAVALVSSLAQALVIDDSNNDLDGDGIPDLANGSYPAGTIIDSDIVFNSSAAWVIDGAAANRDVQSVAVHEVGHFIGLGHSSIRDAAMFPLLAGSAEEARTLQEDDVAYASYLYPDEPAYSDALGSITGRIENGFTPAPIVGAHVFAADPESGRALVGAYSGADGRYLIPGLRPGEVLIGIEPLDGDPPGLDPDRINEVIAGTGDTSFPEEYYDANEAGIEANPNAALAIRVIPGSEVGDIDLVTNSSVVPGIQLELAEGYNLFAYPVEAPSELRAFELLQALGDEISANAIDRFFPGSSQFERAEYVAGAASGSDFPIRSGEGYVVHMDAPARVGFVGAPRCPSVDLVAGLNLIGVACPPPGYSAFDLLADLGDPAEVIDVQTFNPATGEFLTAQYDESGTIVGNDFFVQNGAGYLVNMTLARAGVHLPSEARRFAPVLSGVSPGRGVPGNTVLLIGQGFSPDAAENTVTFAGVPAPVLFATTTSITVTVPGGATSGPLRVNVAGRLSNAIEFVVDPGVVSEEEAAEELLSGQTVEGTLSEDAEQDRYRFTAIAGSRITAHAESVVPGVPDLVLILEDPFGEIVANDDDGGGGTNPRISGFELQNTGRYEVVVTNVPFSGAGAYRVRLDIVGPAGGAGLHVLSGNFQTGAPGRVLTQPLELLVTGANGMPLAGAPVQVEIEGAEIVAAGASELDAATVVINSNADGIVAVEVTLGTDDGQFTVVGSLGGTSNAEFDVAVTLNQPASVVVTGAGQSQTVASRLDEPIRVNVLDATGAPVAGALVGFQVIGGNGTLDIFSTTVQTDAEGNAEAYWTLGNIVSERQLLAVFVPARRESIIVEATALPDPGIAHISSLRTDYSRLSMGTASLRAFAIEALDAYDNPLPGLLVSVDDASGQLKFEVRPGLRLDGTLQPAMRTDANGRFVGMLSPVLPGQFPLGFPLHDGTIPSIDEFGEQGALGLHNGPYTLNISVPNSSPLPIHVDVDMGPTLASYYDPNVSAPIGERVADPVGFSVVRYQREHVDGQDPAGGEVGCSWTYLPFGDTVHTRLAPVFPFASLNFEVVPLEGSLPEGDTGLNPTLIDVTSGLTSEGSPAEFGVTAAGIESVSAIVATATVIDVDFVWEFVSESSDGTLRCAPTSSSRRSVEFPDDNNFATSILVRSRPVIVQAELEDSAAGVNLNSVRILLNDVEIFNGSNPLGVLPVYPERLRIELDDIELTALPDSIIDDYRPKKVVISIHPMRSRFRAENVLRVLPVEDWARNRQGDVTEINFSAGAVGLTVEGSE